MKAPCKGNRQQEQARNNQHRTANTNKAVAHGGTLAFVLPCFHSSFLLLTRAHSSSLPRSHIATATLWRLPSRTLFLPLPFFLASTLASSDFPAVTPALSSTRPRLPSILLFSFILHFRYCSLQPPHVASPLVN